MSFLLLKSYFDNATSIHYQTKKQNKIGLKGYNL